MFLGTEGRLKTKQRENQERDRGERKRLAAFNWRLGWEASCWAAREEGPLGKDLRNRVNRPMELWMFPSYLLLKTTACSAAVQTGKQKSRAFHCSWPPPAREGMESEVRCTVTECWLRHLRSACAI